MKEKKNYEENFVVTSKEDGKKYWISKACAVSVVIYCFSSDPNNNGYFLVHKRGIGCPDNNGKWSVNCGYVGWHEKLKKAAVREVYEEIGLELNPSQLFLIGINDPIDTINENITHRYLVVLDEESVRDKIKNNIINKDSFLRGGEKDEIETIELIPATIDSIYQLEKESGWAFSHEILLKDVIDKYIFHD